MSDTATATEAKGLARLRTFPRTFWVINSSELLERGAYYSLAAVFPLFVRASLVANGMSLADATIYAGNVSAVLFLMLYVVPVLTAPLAERLGYRTSLGIVFTFLAAGYLTASLAATKVGYTADAAGFHAITFGSAALNPTLIWVAVLLIGLGAGLYKPIPAALVAQTSSTENRNFAFSIYYACINVGALVFPTAAGFIALALLGRDASIAFGIAAGLSVVNLAVCLLLFRNLRAPQKDIDLLQGVKRLAEVFKYPAFLVLVIIYTGFWFVYAQSQTSIQQYMTDFNRMPSWFNALFQQSLNPLVIVVATPLMGGILGRFKSLPLIIGGIATYALGFFIVGYSGNLPIPAYMGAALFLLGIVVFSLGELAAHPSYLAYVTKIAPPGKESVFLGYSFIPIGVGYYTGAKFGARIYAQVALNDGRPELFWGIMASVGILTAAAFFLYNHFLNRPSRDVAPGPSEKRSAFGGAARPVIAVLVALLLVPSVIGAALLMNPGGSQPLGASSLGGVANGALSTVKLADDAQTLACGKTYTKTETLDAGATGNATFTVTFTTPPPSSPAATQTPDSYELHVTPPKGDMAMAPASSKSPLAVSAPAMPGDYKVEVVLKTCGAEQVVVPLIGAPAQSTPHTQGSFTLGGSYQKA
jgi:dipeptide/tripeptide permease